jgi:hypothetical protein
MKSDLNSFILNYNLNFLVIKGNPTITKNSSIMRIPMKFTYLLLILKKSKGWVYSSVAELQNSIVCERPWV